MTVIIGAKITTDATALQRDMRRDAKIIESSLGGAFKTVDQLATLPFKTVGKLASSLGSVVGKLTSVNNLIRGAAVGVVGAKVLQVIDRTIKSTGALEIQQRALAGQLNLTTREAGRYIAQVNNASKGLLDFKKSADIAAQAELFGIPREAVPQLIRFASAIAVAKGEAENAIPFIEQLLKGTSGRFGFDELRRVGVDIDERDVAGLDAQAKTAFIVAESLRQLEATSRKLGVTGRELFFTYQGIFGNLQDIRVELGKSITGSERIQKAVKYISDLTAGIAQNLRNNGFEKTIIPLFEKLAQLAGALARDLGEAVAVGIARGIRAGAEAIGLSLTSVLSPEQAERFNRFADRPIGFDRSRQRLRELGEAFEPQDDATRPGTRGRERQVRDDLRRLHEINSRLESGRVLTHEQERELRAQRLAPELEQRRRDEARTELEQERERIQQRTRGGVGRAANELRRVESEIGTGNLSRFFGAARSQLEDEAGFDDLDTSTVRGGRERLQRIRDRARELAEQQREKLLRETGLADLRPASQKVSETTGTTPAGEPGGDTPFIRLGKAFASGITGNTELSAWIDARFQAGGDVVGQKIIDAVGNYDWPGLGSVVGERLLNALTGYDWVGLGTNVGNAIGEAVLNLLPPWLRRWLQARAEAEAEAENANRLNQRSDQDLGSRVRELGDAERARVQRFIAEGNKRNAELPQSEANRLIPTLIESEPVEVPAWLKNIGDSINRFFGHEEPARGINRISDAMDQSGATNIADAVMRRMANAPTVSNTNLVPRDGEGPEMSVRSAQEMLEALRQMGFTLKDGAGVAQDIDRELTKGLAKIQ